MSPEEVLVDVLLIANELVEQGLLPSQYRKDFIHGLSREMRRTTRAFAVDFLRASEDAVVAAHLAMDILDGGQKYERVS